MRATHIWGLTGGIGSGKSTVARILASVGATIVDSDALAKQLTQPGGAAIGRVREVFGDNAVAANGAMDRDWMRQKVFQDPQAKAALEAILHPMIGEATQQALREATTDWVICDVPLLVESKTWRTRVQGVWVVDCEVETQIARVMARNQWPRETVLAVIEKQASRQHRLSAADVVTYNDSITLMELEQAVRAQAQQVAIR